MPNKFIVTNFAYGIGPYLRTTELALAFNDELERRGKDRMGIIVPLVYGERQKKVMAEESESEAGEIIFDEKLGKILGSVFYDGHSSYESYLKKRIKTCREVSRAAHDYLKRIYGDEIALEISRSPRIRYDIAPAYFTSFAYVAEILENLRDVPYEKVTVDKSFLNQGIETANWVEGAHKIYATAYPATFSWRDDYKPRYATEVLTPPITSLPRAERENNPPPNPLPARPAGGPYFKGGGEGGGLPLSPGIYVTITGIPGLERLYSEARTLGLNLYSNDTRAVAGSAWALPHIIPNKNIVFQFARSGWSSIWISMISGTPFVAPDFDSKDDPEIYFNNLAIEKLGIGLVYRGQPLEEILRKIPELQASCSKLRDSILNRWSTLDGNKYCAKLFADDFVS